MRGARWNVTERDLKKLEGKSRTKSVPVSQVGGNDHFRSHVFIRRWSQAATCGTTVSWDGRTY